MVDRKARRPRQLGQRARARRNSELQELSHAFADNLDVFLVNPDSVGWAAEAAKIFYEGTTEDKKALSPWPDYGILSGSQMLSRYSPVEMGSTEQEKFDNVVRSLWENFQQSAAGKPGVYPTKVVGPDRATGISKAMFMVTGPLAGIEGLPLFPVASVKGFRATQASGILRALIRNGVWNVEKNAWNGKVTFYGPASIEDEKGFDLVGVEPLEKYLSGGGLKNDLRAAVEEMQKEVGRQPEVWLEDFFAKLFPNLVVSLKSGDFTLKQIRDQWSICRTVKTLGPTAAKLLAAFSGLKTAEAEPGPCRRPALLLGSTIMKSRGAPDESFGAPQVLLTSLSELVGKASAIVPISPEENVEIYESLQGSDGVYIYAARDGRVHGVALSLQPDGLHAQVLPFDRLTRYIQALTADVVAASNRSAAIREVVASTLRAIIGRLDKALPELAIATRFNNPPHDWYGGPAQERGAVIAWRKAFRAKGKSEEALAELSVVAVRKMDSKERDAWEDALYKDFQDRGERRGSELPILPDETEPQVSQALHSAVFSIYGMKPGHASYQILYQSPVLAVEQMRDIIETIRRRSSRPPENPDGTHPEFNPALALRMWLSQQPMPGAGGKSLALLAEEEVDEVDVPYSIVGAMKVASSMLTGKGSKMSFPKPFAYSNNFGVLLTQLHVPRQAKSNLPDMHQLLSPYSAPEIARGLKPVPVPYLDTQALTDSLVQVAWDSGRKELYPLLAGGMGRPNLLSLHNVSKTIESQKLVAEMAEDAKEKGVERGAAELKAIAYVEILKEAVKGRHMGRLPKEIRAARRGFAGQIEQKGVRQTTARRVGTAHRRESGIPDAYTSPSSLGEWGTKRGSSFSNLFTFAVKLSREVGVGVPSVRAKRTESVGLLSGVKTVPIQVDPEVAAEILEGHEDKIEVEAAFAAKYSLVGSREPMFTSIEGQLFQLEALGLSDMRPEMVVLKLTPSDSAVLKESNKIAGLLVEHGISLPAKGDLLGLRTALSELKEKLSVPYRHKPSTGLLPSIVAGTAAGRFVNDQIVLRFHPTIENGQVKIEGHLLDAGYTTNDTTFDISSGDAGSIADSFVEALQLAGLMPQSVWGEAVGDGVVLLTSMTGRKVEVLLVNISGVEAADKPGFFSTLAKDNTGRRPRASRRARRPRRSRLNPLSEDEARLAAAYVTEGDKLEPTSREDLVRAIRLQSTEASPSNKWETTPEKLAVAFPRRGPVKPDKWAPEKRFSEALTKYDLVSRLAQLHPDPEVANLIETSPQLLDQPSVLNYIIQSSGLSVKDAGNILKQQRAKRRSDFTLQASTALCKDKRVRKIQEYAPPPELLDFSRKHGVVLWLSPHEAGKPRVMTFRRGAWIDCDITKGDIGTLTAEALQASILWIGEKPGRADVASIYIGRIGQTGLRRAWTPGQKLNLDTIQRNINEKQDVALFPLASGGKRAAADVQNYMTALAKQRPKRSRAYAEESAAPVFEAQPPVEPRSEKPEPESDID